MAAITNHESRWRPFTIAINGPHQLAWQPRSERFAVLTAKKLIREGYDFDMGFSQINVRNLGNPHLREKGITVENIFDTCTNVRAAEIILVDCYARARKEFKDRRAALDAALSCYNTGNFMKGRRNGYVGKVYAAQVKGLR
jgi:type IV secretion system protein VirB1